jgi:hypothetical protein
LARYCVVLEELRLEAQTQIERQASAGILMLNGQRAGDVLIQTSQENRDGEIQFAEFSDLGNALDFQMSPENGVPDFASWLHFEAFVCSHWHSHHDLRQLILAN